MNPRSIFDKERCQESTKHSQEPIYHTHVHSAKQYMLRQLKENKLQNAPAKQHSKDIWSFLSTRDERLLQWQGTIHRHVGRGKTPREGERGRGTCNRKARRADLKDPSTRKVKYRNKGCKADGLSLSVVKATQRSRLQGTRSGSRTSTNNSPLFTHERSHFGNPPAC